MATEILKIDASWAEEFTKTSEQILMTPSVRGPIQNFMVNNEPFSLESNEYCTFCNLNNSVQCESVLNH